MSLPTSQLALISTLTTTSFQTIPVPSPGPNEILIKNVACASNPKDWKVPRDIPNYACVEGNDLAGVVVKVGEGVTEFKEGDRVAAFSRMATQDPKYGAYAEYTVSPVVSAFHLGPNTSFEDACTLPLAVMTAALGIFKVLAFPAPPESGFAPPSGQGIVIYGASSSVGAFVTQLAKRIGLFTIGVTGDSEEYGRSFGLDAVLNYKKTPDLESAIVKAAGSIPISHAYDAVALGNSTLLLAKVLLRTSPNGKGKVASTEPLVQEEKDNWPSAIEYERAKVWEAYGPDAEFSKKYYTLIGKWLDDGSLKPNKVRLMPNGLESVEKGVKMLKNHEVHAEKLVYRIADTPQLKATT